MSVELRRKISANTEEAFMKRSVLVLGSVLLSVLATWTVFAQTESHPAELHDASKQGPSYSVHILPLPDNNTGDVSMDYIAYDPGTNSVWVPGGNTGAVDVVDAATNKTRQIPGFPTSEEEFRGAKRVLGPTAVSIGEGVVYIGNRGDSSVCAFNSRSLARGACGRLDSVPDGVAYVAPTNEVWVTTPRDKSISVLDSKTLAQKAKLTFEGKPEGYAVDATRGRFYTNIQDMDRTLAIDLRTRKTVANWNPSCGKDSSHGLAVDAKAGLLFVACGTLAEVLDAGRDGAILSMVDAGDGVDDINYAPATHLLYVGAARAARLTIAHADDNGQLAVIAQVSTHEGARNGVVTKNGTVYLAHAGFTKLSALVVMSTSGQ
jgi:DNA-binding beta-propeller fold protein YncE